MPAACSQESSAECQHWLLSRLNAARATLGLPAYQLPGDFLTLSADRQIFILTDLDRSAYGYTPISGLNAALDEAAAAGVRNGTDPRPPSTESPWRGFGSDWASTGPLLAYYLWMYDDGYPGPNLDCASPGASGCWGHRHVILGEGLPLPQPEVLGVATSQSGRDRDGVDRELPCRGRHLLHVGAGPERRGRERDRWGRKNGTCRRRRRRPRVGKKNAGTSAAAPARGRRRIRASADHRRAAAGHVQPHRGRGQDEASRR